MTQIYKIGKAGFVHMSKTGGSSIRKFCEEHLADQLHKIDIPDTVGHVTPMRTRHYFGDPDLKTFVFVRHPLRWLESTWKYWTKNPNVRPDAMRALGNPFCYWGTTFSQRLLDMIHEGDWEKTLVYWYHHDRYFLLDLYSAFTSGADAVGRSEWLMDGFINYITIVNNKDYVNIYRKALEFGRENVSDIPVPDCTENLLTEFYNINRVIYQKWGYKK